MLNNFINRAQSAFRQKFQAAPLPMYSAVVQVGTFVLLDLRQSAAASLFLVKSFPDTFFFSSINHPNYLHSFFLLEIPPAQFPEWTYDEKNKIFRRTHKDLLNDSLRELSRLMVAKGDIATRVIRAIQSARFRKTTGILSQEDIYLAKRIEALRFRDSGYDESSALQYPYLLQYSEFANFSLREAADEILLKASISSNEMAKTEFLRMKYFKKIREAKTIEELEPIEQEFTHDLYITAKI